MKRRDVIFIVAIVLVIAVSFTAGRKSVLAQVQQIQEDERSHYMNWFLIGNQYSSYMFFEEDEQKFNEILDEVIQLIEQEDITLEEEQELFDKLLEKTFGKYEEYTTP